MKASHLAFAVILIVLLKPTAYALPAIKIQPSVSATNSDTVKRYAPGATFNLSGYTCTFVSEPMSLKNRKVLALTLTCSDESFRLSQLFKLCLLENLDDKVVFGKNTAPVGMMLKRRDDAKSEIVFNLSCIGEQS